MTSPTPEEQRVDAVTAAIFDCSEHNSVYECPLPGGVEVECRICGERWLSLIHFAVSGHPFHIPRRS